MEEIPKFLTPQQASEFTGLAVQTLAKKRVYGTGPRFVKLGRKISYRLSDLVAFMDAHVVSSTSEVIPSKTIAK